MSKQPRDDANYPIPVLSYKLNSGQQITLAGTSTVSAPFSASTRVVSMYSTADCFFEVGEVANTSNSHILPAGLYIDVSLGSENNAANNHKYIAVISSNSGTLYISERV